MFALDLKLKFYAMRQKVETLQTQDVVVQDNEKALVSAGSTDFFVTPGGVGGAGALTQVDYNLSLAVTPHITADGAVQMKLEIKGDSPKNGSGTASKNTRQLQTTLLKQSGETAVIGGLYSSEVSKTQKGIPLLSSIPLIGALFRSTDSADHKKDLLIMVTPTVVGSGVGAANGSASNATSSPVVAGNSAPINATANQAINGSENAATGQLQSQGQSDVQSQVQSQGQSQVKAMNQNNAE
jgi:type IV pilus assembly protein PilQ